MAFLKKIQLQQIILFMNEIMGIYNINKKYIQTIRMRKYNYTTQKVDGMKVE